jgi:glutathione S-transferase
MITLAGFVISNFYNKAKMALLEKGVPFEEEVVKVPTTDAAVLACSPLGKIPFIRTPQGALCESQAILEYLEAAHPNPPLLPADPFAAAKVRELTTFIDWHLEAPARDLYPQAFFGGTVSDKSQERVKKLLTRNIAAFKQLATFAPYVAGEMFTQADCAAYASLPVIAMATRAIYGEDLLSSAGIDVKAYVQLVEQRPSAQRVKADRKAGTAKG